MKIEDWVMYQRSCITEVIKDEDDHTSMWFNYYYGMKTILDDIYDYFIKPKEEKTGV